MKIVYIARHDGKDNDDEGAISFALEKLGHKVFRVDENLNIGDGDLLFRWNPDLILFNKWRNFEVLDRFQCCRVLWYWDLATSDDPGFAAKAKARDNDLRATLEHCDMAFFSDGDFVARDDTGKAHHLFQGADERYIAPPNPGRVKQSLLFTGTVRNHFRTRRKHLEALLAKYKDDFRIVTGRRSIHGNDLARVISHSAIVLAPLGAVTDLYWSNRVYLALGFGGFLIHPYSKLLATQYEPDRELIYYRDREDCERVIDYFLRHPDERLQIARAAYDRTLREHTYRHRCEKLLETVERNL